MDRTRPVERRDSVDLGISAAKTRSRRPAKRPPAKRRRQADLALTPGELETVALRGIVVELGRVVADLVPGALDRALSVTRVRLQQIEGVRVDERFVGEHLALRTRIDLLEQILGRVPTQA